MMANAAAAAASSSGATETGLMSKHQKLDRRTGEKKYGGKAAAAGTDIGDGIISIGGGDPSSSSSSKSPLIPYLPRFHSIESLVANSQQANEIDKVLLCRLGTTGVFLRFSFANWWTYVRDHRTTPVPKFLL